MNRKKLDLVTLHGMGDPPETCFVPLRDALSAPKAVGLWTCPHLERENLSTGELAVARLEHLERLYTTGCNIPVFVSGLEPVCIRAERKNFNQVP